MNRRKVIPFITVLVAGMLLGAGYHLGVQQETETNYLYFAQYGIPAGAVPQEVVDEVTGWVRTLRATGSYDSVRLFIHHTGGTNALFLLIETTDWAALEHTGTTLFEAHPNLFSEPLLIGEHWDELLTEIVVE